MIKSIDLFSQYKTIGKSLDVAIAKVIRSGVFIGGENVEKFEGAFAKFIGVKYCLGVANGTDALEIAIESLGLPVGSEIILPANTFIATAEAVVRSGHKPVFADCDIENYTMSIPDLKKKINQKTSAIIAVHLFGQPCQMAKIKALAGKSIKIIEDCAQAHGAKFGNKTVGSIGDVGTFSFFPAKNLGAFGDGGAIVTGNRKVFERCGLIANHGRVNKNNHLIIGRNSRLDSLQAAILTIKLLHLAAWNRKRARNAGLYFKNLVGVRNLILPKIISDTSPVFHQFVIRHENRDQLKEFLAQSGIESGIHYPLAIVDQPAFKKFSEQNEAPNARKIAREILSLPVAEHLTSNDIYSIIETIKKNLK